MIEIKSLNKKYGNVIALNDVSLSISQGSIIGVLGPNGAGKSTLIRIITGIINPDSGQILINKQPLNKLNVKRIGYLPEERGLYQKMKVGEQAIYLAILKGISHDSAEKQLKYWFEKLNISDWWNLKVGSLSKGMQQKIQFIISVIHEPDLLILDEPFSGLDPINRDLLGNEILELNKQGMTIMLSTHDMNSVEQFCNQVVLIDKGHVILSGEVDTIKVSKKKLIYEFCFKQNPELFFDECNLFKASIISQRKKRDTYSVKIQLHNEREVESILTNVLSKIDLIAFREILPSIHDVFIESISKEI